MGQREKSGGAPEDFSAEFSGIIRKTQRALRKGAGGTRTRKGGRAEGPERHDRRSVDVRRWIEDLTLE